MKNFIFYFFVFILFLSCVTNKKELSKMPIRERNISMVNYYNDSIVNLPLLEIIDTSLYPLLDNIINLNSKCIHVAMGELTWFDVSWRKENDTLTFHLKANQYMHSDINRITGKESGCFYYKDGFFVYTNHTKNATNFLKNTGEIKKIVTYYPDAVVYLYRDCENCYSFYQDSWITYYYMNNEFILKKSYSSCIEYYPVYHQIQEGDNLSKISKMYWVKPEQIIKLNNLNDTVIPLKGELKIQ